MSCYFVDEKTMDKFLSGVTLTEEIEEILVKELPSFASCKMMSRETSHSLLGSALFGMNMRAVMDRYFDLEDDDLSVDDIKEIETMKDIIKGYLFQERPVSKIEAYKAGRCLRYQCFEGNIPNDGLFKVLEKMLDNLAHDIVSDLPEYQEAEWG